MTRPEVAIAQIATVAQAALQAATPDGRGAAYYPAIGNVSIYPSLLLFWGDTPIEYAPDIQFWMVQVKGQLLVSLRGKLASDIARADPVVVPLVDAFAAGSDGYNLKTAATGKMVDFCRIERVIPSLIVEYPAGAGTFYYGAELYWRLKLKRVAGDD